MTSRNKPPLPQPVAGPNTRPSFPLTGFPTAPRGIITPPRAEARPSALPVPARRDVQAFTMPSVSDRWALEAAGVRALAKGDNVITMFETIGEDWWTGGGVTASKVAAQLRAIGDRAVEVHINSRGGDMFEGIAIYNVLREHSQDITVKVMGMAASAASIIAMAGDTVQIGAASFLMIHNCWVVAQGNRHDMRETADFLEPFDVAMTDVYAQRSGQKATDIAAWMDAETFLSGAMAIDRGLADALLPADAMKVDEAAKASDRRVAHIHAEEMRLVQAGMSQDAARERIRRTSGDRPDASTQIPPGAGEDWSGLAGLIATLRS